MNEQDRRNIEMAQRRGKRVDLRGAHIMRINDEGQAVEGWGFTSDQDALDDFFSA